MKKPLLVLSLVSTIAPAITDKKTQSIFLAFSGLALCIIAIVELQSE